MAGRRSMLIPVAINIKGEFKWDFMPDNLGIPQDTGLIKLSVNNTVVQSPALKQGRLWLKDSDTGSKKITRVENKLQLDVYRKIIDDVPLQVLTHFELNVSGDPRELKLTYPLLENFIPLRLTSALPARIDIDGNLVIQVRPGRWQVSVLARHIEALHQLALNTSDDSWPKEEIWVFAARPYQRVVEIQNLKTIDPSQTRLPADWKKFPAYQISQGESMVLKVLRRGDPEPEPDQLQLTRKLWLDFDGQGYSINDLISGKMTRSWRLDALAETQLGRVELDGQSQLITRLSSADKQGIEVRKGVIQLRADSRKTGTISEISAVGWEHDFHQVNAELNLPPGWQLLAATGVDNVPQSWISRWTLLDLFLVLIIALAVYRLWNPTFGFIALLTLVLIWHELGAPQFIWLHILAATALLRVLPEGKFKYLMNGYRRLSWLALLLIAIPFMVDQVRIGLYPQLEKPWQQIQTFPVQRKAEVLASAPAPAMESRSVRKSVSKLSAIAGDYSPMAEVELDKKVNFARLDPNAKIQTGPGLPQWQWNKIKLSWNGSVASQQQLKFWYLSPTMSMLLNFIRVLLLLVLSAVMFGLVKKLGRISFTSPLLSGLILLVFTIFPTEQVFADFPDQEMLQQLRQRLLEKPECLPGCAQIDRMQLEINAQQLNIAIQVNAIQSVAIPLPVASGQWFPDKVLIDGTQAQAMFRSKDNNLWINLPGGQHRVELSGRVPQLKQFTLALPLQPHRVEIKKQGWLVEGLHEHGNVDKQLQFNRVIPAQSQNNQKLENKTEFSSDILPPFVRVERTLRLGLDWSVTTQVFRVSPVGSPLVLSIPLIKGESVTTAGKRVKTGMMKVNMSASQTRIRWDSVLDKSALIELVAVLTQHWTEVWRVDISPVWHMQSSGIPVVHHQDKRGRWLPEWRPWPGEKISLKITRPVAVEGQTLTIDNSLLQIKPGKRMQEATLEFNLRSSQGSQHTIGLPDNAVLHSVVINGKTQPIRQQATKLTFPIVPGEQFIKLMWQQNQGISSVMSTPMVDLGIATVNSKINLQLGQDRWVLFTFGPRFGPAVLIWGVLLVIILIAWGLGKTAYTPLKFRHWLLLLIGLSQMPVIFALVVVAWLFALAYREKVTELDKRLFNSLQIGLVILTLISIALLFIAVQGGLLGSPEMQIIGNQSTAFNLNWYQDRTPSLLPTATAISIPLMAYRLIMLAWALWLAVSLLNWLKWGWQCFTTGGLWKKNEPRQVKKTEKLERQTLHKET